MYRSIVGDQLLGDTSMRTVDFVASSESSTVKQGRVKIGNKKNRGRTINPVAAVSRINVGKLSLLGNHTK